MEHFTAATPTDKHAQQEPPTQPRRRVQRHQPVKIYTLSTSSHSSPHLLYSPSPMTAPPVPSTTNNNSNTTATSNSSKPYNNFVGRSRSVSHSALPPRQRADSTAARMAMEAMIQARLDQINQRLDEFNFQSHELYARTEELAVQFQQKAKRLYQVEDHLLRVQGKPGLSEHYLEHDGMIKKPRRLTNDLEELSIGVRTLRSRFQAMGSVATTVGWLNQLKDKKGANDIDKRGYSRLDPKSTASEREVLGTQRISTTTDKTVSDNSPLDTACAFVTSPSGLRSPPLTPKAPPSGSSLVHKSGLAADDRTHLFTPNRGLIHSSKPRPLSIIPDLEEPPLLPQSHTITVMTTEVSSPLTTIFRPPVSAKETTHRSSDNNKPQSLSSTVFSPPSPASPVEAWARFDAPEHEEGHASIAVAHAASASASSSEPNEETDVEMDPRIDAVEEHEAQRQEREQQEHEVTKDALTQLQQNQQSEQQQQDSLDDEQASPSPPEEDEDCEEVEEESLRCSLKDQPFLKTDPIDTTTKSSQDELQLDTSTIDAIAEAMDVNVVNSTLADADLAAEAISVENQPSETSEPLCPHPSNKQQLQSDPARDDYPITGIQNEVDGWVQILWKLLVRAEYFLLGTAVLGAMMPENIFAFCAGFLSAIMYGVLLIRHRIMASPDTEAPQLPTGRRDRSKRRVTKGHPRTKSHRSGSISDH
ncbi:hypothetical protein BGX28_008797 [Mortierella sp. GBA30]|nr:hypothetical protein BGX28_008797 [Mortierella sp. GBA30]